MADADSGEGEGFGSFSVNNFASDCQEDRERVGGRVGSGRQCCLTVEDDVSPLYEIMDGGITCHRVKDHPDRHFAACQGESSVSIYYLGIIGKEITGEPAYLTQRPGCPDAVSRQSVRPVENALLRE